MGLHVYLAFVFATAVMISLPGPSVLLTVANSISFGSKPALATASGATVGGLMVLAGAGLALARRSN